MAIFSFTTEVAEHIAQHHTTFAGQPATPINVLHTLKNYIGNMDTAEIGAIFEAQHFAGFTTYIYFGNHEYGFEVKESRDIDSLSL